MATKKYNPGFLTDDELVESFCVRTGELESIIETLRESTGNSNQHLLVIGQRGSGKTSLLLRAAIEARRNTELSSRLFPITFAEESYDVGTCGEFWLESLSRLAEQAPQSDQGSDLTRTCEDLRTIQDDRILADHCLGALLDFSDHTGKRLVLVVENLNMMFDEMTDPDAGWRLRKTLQIEPRIILLGSATSRFAAIENSDQALYDLFRVITLRPLCAAECAALWEAVSGESPPDGKIRSLEIVTGGSPRLLSIVAQFGAGYSFHELMADLFDLIDEHTEYFKSHIESLPSQERRVYLALADLWKPATTKEIAARARLGTSTCSAQLKRLINRDVVTWSGGTSRRKQYYLRERMYNIYYLLRRRGTNRIVEALIRFMTVFYPLTELKELSERIVAEARSTDESKRDLYRATLTQMSERPELAEYHEVYRRSISELDVGMVSIDDCNESGSSEQVAAALVNKGVRLSRLNRSDEEIEVYDKVVKRFGDTNSPAVIEQVAKALFYKGITLDQLNRSDEALKVYDEVARRFGDSDSSEIIEAVAKALVNKGVTLGRLNRSDEEIEVYDEVVRRFGDSNSSEIIEQVAKALVNKGVMLGRLNHSDEALKVYDEVARRFGDSDSSEIIEQVTKALFYKGITLDQLNRSDEALKVYDEVARRFGDSDSSEIIEAVAKALVNKGVTLGRLNRSDEEIEVYDEVVRRFGDSNSSEIIEQVAKALVNKGITLGRLNRSDEEMRGPR